MYIFLCNKTIACVRYVRDLIKKFFRFNQLFIQNEFYGNVYIQFMYEIL